MTYTASNLITDAYHLSHVLGAQVEVLNSVYAEKGLNALNELLAVKSMKTEFIPYYREFAFPAIVGQEKYFIPGLVECSSLTFNINTTRYPSQNMTRRDYFSLVKAEGINAIPFRYHLERAYELYLGDMTTGMNLYITYNPSQNYPLKIWGKFALTEVNYNTDLSLFYDGFYRRYMKYELALEACRMWDVSPTPDIIDEFDSLKASLVSMNPPDLTPIRVNVYDDKVMINYAQINIGRGAVPG